MIFNGYAVINELWAYQMHFNKAKLQSVNGRDYHSLSFRTKGEVAFEINDCRYLSKKGDITFMPAGTNYKTEVLSDGEIMLVHFKTAKAYTNISPAFFPADRAEISNCFARLCDSYTADGSHNYLCMQLLYALLDILDRPTDPIPKRMRLAKDYIDKHYAEPISVAALAGSLEISEVHFRNEFKKHYHFTPISYIKKVRIDNAKNLLSSGYYSVSDVAIRCGFDSISYFSYEFRRLTGLTPSEYAKQALD